MALCPNDGEVLTALTDGAAHTFYVCTACNKHFMGTGGILLPSSYTAHGQTSMTSSTTYVTHSQSITPSSGSVFVNVTNPALISGFSLYVSGYSSSNFKVDFKGTASTSGVAFVWQYTDL
jgi:hypothetical protein